MSTLSILGLASVFGAVAVATATVAQPRRRSLTEAIASGERARLSVRHRIRPGRLTVVADRLDRSSRLLELLRASGIRSEPSDVVVACLCGVAAMTAAAALTAGLILAAVTCVLSSAAVIIVIRRRRSARQHEFESALPEALSLLSSALTSGHSMDSSLAVVARRARGAVGEEWSRAIGEARLGMDLLDALQRTATRMNSQELTWVVLVLRINREVGGDLAAVIDTVTATMRARDRQRRRVRALTAEARLSAIILCALPVVFAIYLAVVRPEYLSLLVTSALGVALSAVGLTLLAAGIWWMRLLIRGQSA